MGDAEVDDMHRVGPHVEDATRGEAEYGMQHAEATVLLRPLFCVVPECPRIHHDLTQTIRNTNRSSFALVKSNVPRHGASGEMSHQGATGKFLMA